ncbi:hypothetical protein B0A77_10520 [Flavobacterium branchiophilum]|uniref:Uncharacterized protein n=1 Tax=Flavobacterium branchiophilum TaxID=55197 RepID=A0A2H3KPZ7_9FLAO|nr:hypothetical protein B0A77_10520 [Flavobacterium branchiophilum]
MKSYLKAGFLLNSPDSNGNPFVFLRKKLLNITKFCGEEMVCFENEKKQKIVMDSGTSVV